MVRAFWVVLLVWLQMELRGVIGQTLELQHRLQHATMEFTHKKEKVLQKILVLIMDVVLKPTAEAAPASTMVEAQAEVTFR